MDPLKTVYAILAALVVVVVAVFIINAVLTSKKNKLRDEIARVVGMKNGNEMLNYRWYDTTVRVNSRQSVEKYTLIKYFQEHPEKTREAEDTVIKKTEVRAGIKKLFNAPNEFEKRTGYRSVKKQFTDFASNLKQAYLVRVVYTTPAGRKTYTNTIPVYRTFLEDLKKDPTILMTATERKQYEKAAMKKALEEKQEACYNRINSIIDAANTTKEKLVCREKGAVLDDLISGLFERTVVSVQKAKSAEDKAFDVIEEYIGGIEKQVNDIVEENETILHYYESEEFAGIKKSCDNLMKSQRDFNEYIDEKARSISSLLGAGVLRNETVNEDVYQYFRPYKKEITPFTAEVSQAVFASAENSPMDYVIKCFYNNKASQPEQLQKLHTLVEELETLSEAKEIIARQKEEYSQYIQNVPEIVMAKDANGFFSRLGFANIDERVLSLEYKFSYTSNGGFARRSFTVPMTEDNIVKLIGALESKMTYAAFAKEQRSLMTSGLRLKIKERDNYTCRICGNSTHCEPNLLLEIDHIIPVAKGGTTIEENLQTLCWKCNRAKSDKIIAAD